MTSDAKIGLLLGLIFIFIIAFVINGLPTFRSQANNNELTTGMVGVQNEPPALGAMERKAAKAIRQTEQPKRGSVSDVRTTWNLNEDIRFKAPLPGEGTVGIAKETIEAARQTMETEGEKVRQKPPEPVAKKRSSTPGKHLVRTYVVTPGDNLAVIAQKFYGSEEGNRKVNIDRIFQVNRKLLKSADAVYVGQKLLVPPLSQAPAGKSKIDTILNYPMLEKVKSIGKRHFSGSSRKSTPVKQYVVREGDSLWQIATTQLGNGSRYAEISRLNADVLDDEDSLAIGMRLKLPNP